MSNEIQKQDEPRPIQLTSVDTGSYAGYLDSAKFNQIWRAAQLFSKTDLVPAHYKGKPENCFLAFNMALRIDMDPFMFMTKTYVVGGKIGMESQLVIALMNARGPFTSPIEWIMSGAGEDRKCTAFATHKVTGNKCEATVTWKMVVDEGWASKAGSKWKTMPDQMFKYRSAAFLCNLYCPEVKFGIPMTDELDDITEATVPVRKGATSSLEEKLAKTVESTAIDAVAVDNPEEKTGEKKDVFVDFRFVCNNCSHEYDNPKGVTKLCPICLSNNTVDRRPE